MSDLRPLHPRVSSRDQWSAILAERHPQAVVWAEQFVLWRQQRLDLDGFDMAGSEDTMFAWFAGAMAAEADRPHPCPHCQPGP